MSWSLKHRLFGWHYVAVTFGGRDSVCRVQRLPTGETVIHLFGEFYRLSADCSTAIAVNGGQARRCTPLTWCARAAA